MEHYKLIKVICKRKSDSQAESVSIGVLILMASIRKNYHELGGLKTQKLIFLSSGGQKSKVSITGIQSRCR